MLTRISCHPISGVDGELRLFAVIRNEAVRLPFFLNYYWKRGVSRFFIVDNDSCDNTREILEADRRVHLFHTKSSYAEARYGVAWLSELLKKHGNGHWCLIVDADEIAIYPYWEQLSFGHVCSYLDEEGSSAMQFILLDMYSRNSIETTYYNSGDDPLKICNWFESDTVHCIGYRQAEFSNAPAHFGGMRKRVFGVNACLDKISLIKMDPKIKIWPGMHKVSNARLSKLQGAVLHFKYFADFNDRAKAEAKRQEHWRGAVEYKSYAENFDLRPNIAAFNENSKQFVNSGTLLNCQIMKSTQKFDNTALSLINSKNYMLVQYKF